MELIEGRDFTHNVTVPVDAALRFMARLDEFHKLGLYHGDLSTRKHFILTPDGEIRLIDPIYMPVEIPDSGVTLEKLQATDRGLALKMLNELGISEDILTLTIDNSGVEVDDGVRSMPVEQVMEKYGVVMVHGFGDKNAFLKGDWITRLKNLLVNRKINISNL